MEYGWYENGKISNDINNSSEANCNQSLYKFIYIYIFIFVPACPFIIPDAPLICVKDKFGPGCITVDKIVDEPTCRAVANNLEGFEATPGPVEVKDVKDVKVPAPVVPAMPAMVVAKQVPSATTLCPQLAAESQLGIDTWVRTTHVGSLPRPADGILDLNQVIAQQEGCVDVINDGEWGRENYIADVINRVVGLNGGDIAPKDACCAKHAMPVAADMKDVPLYAQRFSGGNGLITLNPKREAVSPLSCVAHPKYTPAEIPNLKAFLTAANAAGKDTSDSCLEGWWN